MIKGWRHKGLKKFYETGSKAGIQPKHAEVLSMLLLQLTSAIKPEDMNTPGNYFHSLQGDLAQYYSVKVSGNWRLIFQFEGQDAILVDYLDYH
ncbi:MAG: type II toxin-antitoxin system RelE/ParE family toxin [Legionellales bacterium]|nr:type II toxin-antitoxin system RelE/ParE family toxin [Legionellales bacterium]